MARIHLLLHRFVFYKLVSLSLCGLPETRLPRSAVGCRSIGNASITLKITRTASKLSSKMASVAAKRALLSTKAKAFSIASLVDQGNKLECGQADDNVANESTGEQPSSSTKKRKLLDDCSDATERRKPQAVLEGRELWECFYRLGTEMIITKSGRRMFPPLRVSFTDLDPLESYAVLLDIIPLDNKRHRYSYTDSAWFVAGEADPTPPRRVYVHPESPFTGEELARQVLSFERVKLTNNPKDVNGNIILNSMHKYQPRVHLVKNPTDKRYEQELDKADAFIFPETAFMAVTAYQNHLITRLKIYSNPFAKGFRDTTRLLPSFEDDGFIIQSDEFPGCCDGREGLCCCHVSGQLGCYHHQNEAMNVAGVRARSAQDTRWSCTEECCHGSEYPWRQTHSNSFGYARSIDFYSREGAPYALLSCPTVLAEERLRDY